MMPMTPSAGGNALANTARRAKSVMKPPRPPSDLLPGGGLQRPGGIRPGYPQKPGGPSDLGRLPGASLPGKYPRPNIPRPQPRPPGPSLPGKYPGGMNGRNPANYQDMIKRMAANRLVR